jgi:hypothetical protein
MKKPMLKLDPSALKPVPDSAFPAKAQNFQDLVGNHPVAPLAGQMFMSSVIFGEGGLRFVHTMTLAVAQGVVEVQPHHLRSALAHGRKTIMAVGPSDEETVLVKVQLITALQSRVAEALANSGNTQAEILSAFEGDDCTCASCTTRREQREGGVDDPDGLARLARHMASGKEPAPPKAPENLMDLTPLALGSNDLGEGWEVFVAPQPEDHFYIGLWDGTDRAAEGCGPSLARALVALWANLLEDEVVVPEAQLRTLAGWVAVANIQACNERCRASSLEITELVGTDGKSPHEDGDYSKRCDNPHCRCQQ